jgi:hypothetical protein
MLQAILEEDIHTEPNYCQPRRTGLKCDAVESGSSLRNVLSSSLELAKSAETFADSNAVTG